MGRMFETDQAREFSSLWSDLIRKVDTRFSDLEASTQRKFIEAARDISKLRDDLDNARTNAQARFVALADHYHRGGEYRGCFRDINEAADFGRAAVAIAKGDRA